MKWRFRLLFSLIVALQLSFNTAAIDPLVIKGSKFFNSKTKKQFFFKGVDYQPRSHDSRTNLDPLSEVDACLRDAKILKELNVNSIRVYETDYNLNHDKCMAALEEAGIYVILDIATPLYSINRNTPFWDVSLYDNFKKKVDAFAKYPNVVAFLIGNEITNDRLTTPASAFVKASLRDIKTYIKANNYNVYVGYADNDDEEIRVSLINYFNCGDDPMSRADFYGINTYRWCGPKTTYESSGYAEMSEPLKGYSIPVMITEYGCNTVRPRNFNEVSAVYGENMIGIYSGGFVYEYSQEENDYGIVKITNGKAEKLPDFYELKKMYTIEPSSQTTFDSYNPSLKVSECPQITEFWKVKSKILPPTPSIEYCNCMADTFKCSTSQPSQNGKSLSNSEKSLGKVVDYICGTVPCNDTSTDTLRGIYGPMSFCSPLQKANYIINKKFLAENEGSSACSYNTINTSINKDPKVKELSICNKFSKQIDLKPSLESTPPKNDPPKKKSNSHSTKPGTTLQLALICFVLMFIKYVF
ncbi:pH-responsive protein 1 [Smittium mucronatum]|uniref:1,3-beta-glucanosyltransferase n=1 Tax=Smittium mucronatum TaxID=133383 RepID=A0A1R0H8L5_9FUNG|nr:pH-responsive protein 1 [Smittium mucronatum]